MMTNNERYIIGNWKLYLGAAESVRVAKRLAQTFRFWPVPGTHVAVCPTMPVLAKTYDVLIGSRLELGCQDVGLGTQGPMTGDVAVRDLADIGCTYALVGHSERRAAGDDEALVKKKLLAAAAGGLVPVLFVGERNARKRLSLTLRIIRKQLRSALSGFRFKKLLVVYEPVWAVSRFGKGTPCPAAYAFAIAEGVGAILQKMRREKNVTLLYGGSVDKTNILSYADGTHFRGAVVGNASTNVDEYVTLVKHVST